MFIKLTEHFKGSLPIDAGGVVFGGYGAKQVGDKIGAYVVKANFPMVVECDADGKPLKEVPPVPVQDHVEAAPQPSAGAAPKASFPWKTAAGGAKEAPAAGVDTSENTVQPTVEDVGETYDTKADEAEDREEEDKAAGKAQDKKAAKSAPKKK